jgi:alkanesulfonate monooxygenase SsuD/methylene tetrahydromethanopterin reductase-like flavin-dependent oxidoreductase (luciferase family)
MLKRGFGIAAATPIETLEAVARAAEEAGYTSFWVNHPGNVDGLALLAAAAGVTSRIELGVGVIPLHVRDATDIARGARDLRLPLDRLLLGVGSAGVGALGRVREGARQLRQELGCRVVVAALGPKMCGLAGEVGDGVLFNWLTPAYARVSAELVREGAAQAGRETPALVVYVRLATGPTAGPRLDEEGSRYASVSQYGAHFERMAAAPGETGIAAQSSADVAAALAAWDGAVDEVVLRALPEGETVDEQLGLVRAGAP